MAIQNFDYQDALRQADRIDDAADLLEQVRARQVAPCAEALRTGWTGDAADAFARRMRDCGDAMRDEIKTLRELAARVRTAARAIEQAEQRAREQVQNNQIRSL